MAEKKTKGKQKIAMKTIENMEDRLSTFSKRRVGIYKKLNDLIFTCDAEVGLLMFTKSDATYTFGHPSFETMVDKLMNPFHRHAKRSSTDSLLDANKRERMERIYEEYEKLLDALEDEKERRELLEKVAKEKNLDNYWWKTKCEKLEGSDIQEMHDAFFELHEALCDELIKRMHQNGEGTSSNQQKPSH